MITRCSHLLTYVHTYLLIFHTAKNNDADTLVWRNIQQIKKAVTNCTTNWFEIPQEFMEPNNYDCNFIFAFDYYHLCIIIIISDVCDAGASGAINVMKL